MVVVVVGGAVVVVVATMPARKVAAAATLPDGKPQPLPFIRSIVANHSATVLCGQSLEPLPATTTPFNVIP